MPRGRGSVPGPPPTCVSVIRSVLGSSSPFAGSRFIRRRMPRLPSMALRSRGLYPGRESRVGAFVSVLILRFALRYGSPGLAIRHSPSFRVESFLARGPIWLTAFSLTG